MTEPKIPLKLVFDENDDPSGLAEFVSGEDHISSGILQLSGVGSLLNLSSLADVSSYPNATSGYVLTYVGASDGTFQVLPSAPSSNPSLGLYELTDVDPTLVSPSINELLIWTGAQWEGSTIVFPAEFDTSTLSSLGDVSSGLLPVASESLVWNGTVWTASAVTAALGPTDLADLTDVSSYPDILDGQVLTWSGTTWIASANDGVGETALSGLTDVSSALLPTTNQSLVWNGNEWTASTVEAGGGGGGATALSGLTDVSSSIVPTDYQVLVWSSTEWTASTVTETPFPSIGTSSLSGLADVSTSIIPINKDGLVWDGTQWTASSVLFADGSVSTTGDIVFGGDLHFSPSGIVSSVGAIQFHLTPGTVHSEGLLHWSDNDKTLDIDTEIADFHVTLAQQQVIRVINKTGLTVSAGQCVHVSGVQGNNPTIGLTNASAINDQNLFGVVNKDINNSNTGYITTFGMVRDIDTSIWSPADILYLSNTDGLLSTTQPLAPDHKAKIAVVVTSNATEGQMFVHTEPFSQAEVSSIHDVSSYPDIVPGQVLTWSGTQWIASSNDHLTDHGALTGLGDDDHTQYLLTDGTRILTGNQNFGGLVADNYGPLSSTLSAVNSTEYLAGTETNYRVWSPNDISGAIWSFAGSSADILKYEMANGVVSGGVVTAHSTNISAVDVASGTAIFWLSALETSKKINFGATELVISGIPTNTVTHLCINPDGTFSQESTALTGEARRNCVNLAQIGHSDNTQVRGIVNRHDVALNIGSQLRDLATAVGTINLGVRLAADSAGNLQLDRSAGTLVRLGDNWFNNPYRPSESDISASANISFRLRTQTGLGSNNNLNLDVGNYDNGGTVTAIAGTKYQNFRAYQLPNGNLVIQYGQNLYTTLTNAEEGIATETFTLLENLTDSAVLISIISVASNATDLTNTNQAAFTTPTKFGDIFAGIGGQAGVDHGSLAGLADDDHTQYLLVDGTRAMTGNLDMGNLQIINVSGVDGRDVAVDGAKLDGIESNATADQSDAEIETAYNNQVAQVSEGERTAGTETAVRRFSPADVSSMVYQHQTAFPSIGTSSLSGLADVSSALLPTTNQVLIWDGDEWTASTIPEDAPFPSIGTSALSGLSDVSSAILPTDYQVLVWSSTEWTASTITETPFPSIGTSALSGLSDTSSFPDIIDGQVLTWDDTNQVWVGISPVAGVTDHGALTGLSDDDHTQYLLVDGTRAMTGNLDMGNVQIINVSGVDGRDVAVDGSKLDGIESGATADQSDAEIETAYNNQVSKVTLGEITAGSEVAVRRFSPADVRSMVITHESDHAISGLTDVSSALLPTANQSLVWDGDEWTASTIEAGGGEASAVVSITWIFDESGSAISTGTKGYVEIPFDCSVMGWTLLADVNGSAVVDVWKDTYANYPPVDADSITNSNEPTITDGVKGQDLDLANWTTQGINAGDILGFNVDSVSAFTFMSLSLSAVRI